MHLKQLNCSDVYICKLYSTYVLVKFKKPEHSLDYDCPPCVFTYTSESGYTYSYIQGVDVLDGKLHDVGVRRDQHGVWMIDEGRLSWKVIPASEDALHALISKNLDMIEDHERAIETLRHTNEKYHNLLLTKSLPKKRSSLTVLAELKNK